MLARRKHYLSEMGIDVWVLREGRRATSRPSAQQSPQDAPETPEAMASDAPRTGSSATRQPAPAPAGLPPEFHLCFATYDGVSLIFSVPQASTSLPDNYRRFADDIATALGVSGKPAISALRWPLVKADIDQSEDAARTVLEQRLGSCARQRLLFGDDAAAWCGKGGETRVADLQRYLDEPLAKRELWQALKQVKR